MIYDKKTYITWVETTHHTLAKNLFIFPSIQTNISPIKSQWIYMIPVSKHSHINLEQNPISKFALHPKHSHTMLRNHDTVCENTRLDHFTFREQYLPNRLPSTHKRTFPWNLRKFPTK